MNLINSRKPAGQNLQAEMEITMDLEKEVKSDYTEIPDVNRESEIIRKKYAPSITPGALTEGDLTEIRQCSHYDSDDKAAPDNNLFFEERSNPLSSKGN